MISKSLTYFLKLSYLKKFIGKTNWQINVPLHIKMIIKSLEIYFFNENQSSLLYSWISLVGGDTITCCPLNLVIGVLVEVCRPGVGK